MDVWLRRVVGFDWFDVRALEGLVTAAIAVAVYLGFILLNVVGQ